MIADRWTNKWRDKQGESYIPPSPKLVCGGGGGITINYLGHELKNIRNNTSLTVGLSIDFCDFSIDYYFNFKCIISKKPQKYY